MPVSTTNHGSLIDLLSASTRKFIFIFKSLHDIADKHDIKMICLFLCQSALKYCTTCGGVPKSSLIRVDRGQKIVLKVSRSLPFLFPTFVIYVMLCLYANCLFLYYP